ncbi:MAG: hydantoinase B/oxoprolinase family protein [Desulfobacula sp.]|jgi:N-methylhydantoinase B|uniref:hydantoinase B/oxoprolinase family protein n=2 Tax=Desulfobacula sp. TaxID=2593537 RepID=UPI001D902984|nr:hydantoinase B/oxoprolinase family protein [Desulfobacula sp.]MBT3486665.1 hydantoinase B/oxoprolinase family protein [Desulfobacula sp.]MBT4026658.1 hydantoinase B/oxoprolinase family protein [Desulfobacula sp.]MBT4506596.1 hydantoinase B/oxoprolinase family protein [Desulfobacula sp.]MBT4876040.1 hydantoinase B/oxoprolinase family protein [Desulfobacula sp.]
MNKNKCKFDPITLEILWKRLVSIVDESDASVIRTAFSSLLRDAHDYTCMFTDSRGQELVQGTLCTPGMAGAMALGMKKIVNSIPLEDYNDGDVFIINDPWLLAGHLNDVCVWSPIFFKGRPVAFTACIFHHTDIGGRTASDNRDVYAEGLYIPLTKLYDAGKLNKGLVNMIRWNVRTATEFDGDIRSQVAANHVCSQKIIEMMEDEGLSTLDDLADEIIDRTEISMRAAIEKIKDGTYAHEGIIEGAGSKPDIPIKLSVKVDGSKIHVDFDGTSKQVDWGVNVVYNFTYAYVFMAIKSAFDPGVPINEGAIRPITMTAPKGSIVNCKFPAAVAARMVVGHFMTEMVFKALAKAAPDNIIAGSGGTPAQTNIFHGSFANGKPWHTMIIRGGGMGASSKFDGHHCAIFPANGANTPVEILESDTTMIVESRGLVQDSGGPGKQRGGIGRQMIIRSPEDGENSPGTTSIAVQAGRYIYPPEGIFGGKDGSLAQYLKNGENADPSGLTFMEPGDRVSFVSAGGGGYGDPFEREAKAVERDVQYGYVSIEKAKKDYGVIIDPVSLKVDLDATKTLREEK